MANEKIMLMAEAGKLGIDGYRRMGIDELKEHIAKARGSKAAHKAAPAKGKATTNGKAPAKTTVAKGKATPAKGKSAAKPAPAKGRATVNAPAKGKSAPAKSTKPATKAATGTAKRQTAAKPAAKATTAKGKTSTAKGKSTPARASSTVSTGKCKNHPQRKAPQTRGMYANLCTECIEKRSATTLGAQRQAYREKVTTRKRGAVQGRVLIDRTKVDWQKESSVGARGGKREEVLKMLRKYKGSYTKTYEALKDKAKSYYKGKSKAEAEKTLRWLINRVAFDYVMDTEQHVPGQRAAYGTSDKAVNVKRREQRGSTGRTAASRTPAKGRGTATSTRKPAGAQKPAQRRTAASKKKATTTRGRGKAKK